ncbi:MAG: hypothetical protein CL940_09910 [Deltaproteobacteria bacterium]|nr:hypothetical protein [Deltaproteobacteria bacterium]
MVRCNLEIERARTEDKSRELTREEQVARLPITADELVREVGPTLFRLARPEALREIHSHYAPRMSRRQRTLFVEFMEQMYGTPFCRKAGLPVGGAKLSLAS